MSHSNQPFEKTSDPAPTNDEKIGSGSRDFIRTIINEDVRDQKRDGRVTTRFPPEPNGYLHIGHAKSICLNFGIAQEYGGQCHLRFDDTNPTKEDTEYVEAIEADVRWLGYDWGGKKFFSSDYFDRLFEFAVTLIKKGRAYVCDLTGEQIREYRGTLSRPGRDSPFRDRPIEENLELFHRMRAGEFADGARVLRAKIDMASPNVCMRDPTLYRIRRTAHHRTGDKWCIYPMYDFTHCLSDSIEKITHSLCTLEFENNRPLYDWILAQLDVEDPPQQIEFARLNLSHTVMSKRKLLRLVTSGHVSGWDDPRMPTLAGLRRRGYTPQSIRTFCDQIGIAKANSTVDLAQLEHVVRDDLNTKTPRALVVLDPVKVIIDNYPEDEGDELEAPYFPDDPGRMGLRTLPFSRALYIERDDFMEVPSKKFHRLAPGKEVRLRWAYLVTCTSVVKDEQTGQVTEIHCRYDPATRGGTAPDGRRVKGTIHWVSAADAVPVEVRLYDRLLTTEKPDQSSPDGDFTDLLNSQSLEVRPNCLAEPSIGRAQPGDRFQFERIGYFIVDRDSTDQKKVFNRTVALKDSWKRLVQTGKA